MKKNGRTIRQDILIIRRGIREFEKILPGQMLHVFWRSFLTAGIPFLTAAVSAQIIDALAAGKSRDDMLVLSLGGVGLLFLLTLWKNWEECKIEVGYSRLFSSHEVMLTNKSYSLPYEVLERDETKRLRDQVSASLNLSGGGMASLYWDMDILWTNGMTAVISLAVLTKVFGQMLIRHSGGNLQYGDTYGMICLILVLVAFCSWISCKMTGKRFDVAFELFRNGSGYSRYGDFYTMDYLQDEDAAMDARIYRQEEMILSECQSKCYEHFAEGKRKEMNAASRYDGLKRACSCICGCIVYILIGQKALQGVISCGSIILLYTSVTMVIEALARAAEIVTDLRNNNEHLIRYIQYIDLPETEGQDIRFPETLEDKNKIEKIVFQNVTFQYPESETFVLQNVNLEIRPGEKLAIVGENGSGKTTLIKLLCRLYRPTEGKILLNGKDIWEYPYDEYRSFLAAVFQDFSLFAFSLAENIAASQEYDSKKVWAALEKAGLMEKANRLENGIEQHLFHDFDEDGTDLSGGEAQKVAIARAVYKDSAIFILDEPTAALDPYAEYDIYRNFVRISAGKTVLSVSHRLSSCRMCDRIAVLHQGKIVQCGTHEELVKEKDGKYFELWSAQAQYYRS